jgi:hypothetical protein
MSKDRLSDDELIITNVLSSLLEKYSKETLCSAAQWLLEPQQIMSRKLILKDDKGWESQVLWPVDRAIPSTYRIRKPPKLNLLSYETPSIIPSNIPTDYEFKLKKRSLNKMECKKCLEEMLEYEMI